jgi:hypothetical protein
MKIQLADGVLYDDAKETQDEAFYAWVREQVEPRLGGENSLPCTRDKFGRPTEYTLETGEGIVRVRREYISPTTGSWAKKQDKLLIERKEVSNEAV